MSDHSTQSSNQAESASTAHYGASSVFSANLHLLSLAALLCVAFTSQPALSADGQSSPSQTFPPYPNVWHRFIPSPRLDAGLLDFFRMPNGDYSIVYAKDRSDSIKGRMAAVEFFGGSTAGPFDIRTLLRKNYAHLYGKTALALPSGARINLESLDPRPVKRCPQDLYHYYRIEYPDGRAAEQKALLYVLDRPRQQEIQPLCADTLERSFTEKVVSVQGLLVPLDDGTFLLSDRHLGVVLRFDPSFHTKSDLLNRKLFVVDPKLIQHYMTEGSTSYQGMQDGVLGIVKQRSEGK